jgi:hypothetical protein
MTKLLPLIVNALYLRLAAPLLVLAAQFALSSCDDCLVGGTFSDRGNLDSDGNPKITPANGYAWQMLYPAETVTTHGYDLTFNYIVSLQ